MRCHEAIELPRILWTSTAADRIPYCIQFRKSIADESIEPAVFLLRLRVHGVSAGLIAFIQ
jgi:hypothetical protein